jgi:predicted nucleotidyltransferase
MKENIQKELTTIIQAVASNTKIENIFLFGSWAYGEPKPDSDLDIYLVIPDNDADICDLNAEIRFAPYKKLTLPLDLVIAKKSVFERRSKALTLESIIAKQGVRIYGNGNYQLKHREVFGDYPKSKRFSSDSRIKSKTY